MLGPQKSGFTAQEIYHLVEELCMSGSGAFTTTLAAQRCASVLALPTQRFSDASKESLLLQIITDSGITCPTRIVEIPDQELNERDKARLITFLFRHALKQKDVTAIQKQFSLIMGIPVENLKPGQKYLLLKSIADAIPERIRRFEWSGLDKDPVLVDFQIAPHVVAQTIITQNRERLVKQGEHTKLFPH